MPSVVAQSAFPPCVHAVFEKGVHPRCPYPMAVVQSLQVFASFNPVNSVPVHTNVEKTTPFSLLLIGLLSVPSVRSALLVATVASSPTRTYMISGMRSLAATVLVDNHAAHVPPRLAALASPWHLESAPVNPPRSPRYSTELWKTCFGSVVVVVLLVVLEIGR